MQQYNKKVLEKILAKATKGKKKKDRNERFRKGDKSSLKWVQNSFADKITRSVLKKSMLESDTETTKDIYILCKNSEEIIYKLLLKESI